LKKIYLLILLFTSIVYGIDLSEKTINLSPLCSIYKTNTDILEPTDLDISKFTPNTKGIENFGYSTDFFWVKCNIKNNKNSTMSNIFELGFTPMDYVDFYEYNSNNNLLNHYQSGDLRDINVRVIKNKNHLFPIKFEPFEEKIILLKVQNSGAVTIDLKLYDKFFYFFEIYAAKQVFIISFLSIILFLTIYNLVLFISLKDISFIYYFIAMFSMFTYQSTLFGVAYEYASFLGLWNLTVAVNISGALFTAFSILFVSSYFELEKYSPKINKFSKFMIIIFYSIAITLLMFDNTYSKIASILPLFGMLMIIWIFILTIIGFKSSPINARFIFIGWGISGVLMILYVSQIVGFIHIKIIDDLSVRIGTLIEMVFFSFALGDKLRFLKDENSKIKIKALEYEKQLLINSRLAVAGETVGNIAHQWRQPLNRLGMIFVKIQTKLHLKQEIDAEELNINIKESESILDEMANTIDLFLDFFTPNNSNQNFLLNECIDSAINIINDSLTQNNIELINNCDKNIYLSGSSNEFSQVILNLLSNAKYINLARNTEKPFIQIKTTVESNKIIILVEDNAGGISIDPIEKIFEPYISTKENKNGTGLGLYIAKKIVCEKLKGDIKVSNTIQGAKFELILPIKNQNKEEK
jgi:signal transduction histidine kinase